MPHYIYLAENLKTLINMIKSIFKSLLFILLFLLSTNGFSQEADSVGYIVKNGEMAPNFEMKLIDGQTISLHDLKGKIVMLQFTASWCSVCRKEMPFIEKEIWQIHKDKDFIVIGIDRDEPLDKVIDFAKKMEITYPLSLDPNADIFGLFALKKTGVTRNVIIDKEGHIVFKTRLFNREEFDLMKEKIETLLK